MLELLSRIELPNLFLTKEVLYQLSYNSASTMRILLYFQRAVNGNGAYPVVNM